MRRRWWRRYYWRRHCVGAFVVIAVIVGVAGSALWQFNCALTTYFIGENEYKKDPMRDYEISEIVGLTLQFSSAEVNRSVCPSKSMKFGMGSSRKV